MNQPEQPLAPRTRIRLNSGRIGTIVGTVAGCTDAYWVAHFGDLAWCIYRPADFELALAKNPCPDCAGTSVDWNASWKFGKEKLTHCPACNYTGEASK